MKDARRAKNRAAPQNAGQGLGKTPFVGSAVSKNSREIQKPGGGNAGGTIIAKKH
jgi:hypothetical protein